MSRCAHNVNPIPVVRYIPLRKIARSCGSWRTITVSGEQICENSLSDQVASLAQSACARGEAVSARDQSVFFILPCRSIRSARRRTLVLFLDDYLVCESISEVFVQDNRDESLIRSSFLSSPGPQTLQIAIVAFDDAPLFTIKILDGRPHRRETGVRSCCVEVGPGGQTAGILFGLSGLRMTIRNQR